MNIILKKDFFNLRIIKQRQQTKSEYLKKLSQSFNSYSTQISDNNSDEQINLENLNLEESLLNDTNKLSPTKNHYFGLIPKIIGALNMTRPKLSSSIPNISTATLLDNEISPKISPIKNKRNPWILYREKMKHISSTVSSICFFETF
jgi:hypothetical protein